MLLLTEFIHVHTQVQLLLQHLFIHQQHNSFPFQLDSGVIYASAHLVMYLMTLKGLLLSI